MASIECPLHSLLTLAVHHLFHRLQTAIFSFIKNKRFSFFLHLITCLFDDKKLWSSFFIFATHLPSTWSIAPTFPCPFAKEVEGNTLFVFFWPAKCMDKSCWVSDKIFTAYFLHCLIFSR